MAYLVISRLARGARSMRPIRINAPMLMVQLGKDPCTNNDLLGPRAQAIHGRITEIPQATHSFGVNATAPPQSR